MSSSTYVFPYCYVLIHAIKYSSLLSIVSAMVESTGSESNEVLCLRER